MHRRATRIRAATLDEPCPEFGPFDEVLKVGDLVLVVGFEDEFDDGGVGLGRRSVRVDPSWRDRHEWGWCDEAVGVAFDFLRSLASGLYPGDGLYCLPYEWVEDICRAAGAMLDSMAAAQADGTLRWNGGDAPLSFAVEALTGGPDRSDGGVEFFPQPFPLWGFGLYGRMD